MASKRIMKELDDLKKDPPASTWALGLSGTQQEALFVDGWDDGRVLLYLSHSSTPRGPGTSPAAFIHATPFTVRLCAPQTAQQAP